MDLDLLLSGDPAQAITVTIAGRTFKCGRRTAAHLLWTFELFASSFPDLELVIAQTCYHEGYAPSAGTHDKDGCLDFYVQKKGGGLATDSDYWLVQRWMRNHGWGIWFRHTGSWAARGNWHLHGISLGCPGPLGIYVDGGLSSQGRIVTSSQIADYFNHTYGLANQHTQDADHSAFPGDQGPPPWPTGTPAQWREAIQATFFDYQAWKDEHDMMTPQQEDLLKKAASNTDAILKRLDSQKERDAKRHQAVMAALDELDGEVRDVSTQKQVAKARQKILAALADDETAEVTP